MIDINGLIGKNLLLESSYITIKAKIINSKEIEYIFIDEEGQEDEPVVEEIRLYEKQENGNMSYGFHDGIANVLFIDEFKVMND